MSDAPWIQIEYTRSRKNDTKDLRAITVGLNVAPHQIPKAVRGYFDNQAHRVVIELRYADDEDFRLERQDDRVCLRLGRHSRRLLGLELNTINMDTSKVQLKIHAVERIEEAVQKLILQEPTSKERENYSYAMKAIESGRSRLSSELLAPA